LLPKNVQYDIIKLIKKQTGEGDKVKKSFEIVFRFIKDNLFVTLSYILFYIMFRVFVGGSAALVIIVVFITYSTSMFACEYGMTKIQRYEREESLTSKRLSFYSVLVALPIYFVWLLIAVIPIPQYEVWFITGFPAGFFCFMPLQSLSEHWTRGRKKWFWVMQLVLYAFCFMAGQIVCRVIFKNL